MNITLDEKIKFIGRDKFVKYTNTDEFPELSEEVRNFLKNIGIYSNEKGYPYLTINGKLKKFKENCIQFGEGHVGTIYYIDILDGERIKGHDEDEDYTSLINSSILKYINCLYALYYYTDEIEDKEIYGEYWKNHKKYAAKLKELFEEYEPNIEKYSTWAGRVEEMDLGII